MRLKQITAPLILLFYISPIQSHADNFNLNSLHSFFTTPEIRRQLNKRRASKDNLIKRATIKAPIITPVTISFQGLILRKNSLPVVFINDQIFTHKNPDKDYRLNIKLNHKSVHLKPGENIIDNVNAKTDQ